MSATRTDLHALFAVEALQRIAADLTMITDRPFTIDPPRVERARARPAGRGQVHIAFKLGTQRGPEIGHGAFLVSLPEAVSLAGYLMMATDDVIARRRLATALDSATKDALLEIGNFVAGATEAALRSLGVLDVRVRSEGCQGVRADVRPAFAYVEGVELVVARARARLSNGSPFDVLWMLPAA